MNTILWVLIAASFVAVNLLRGGARHAYALPGYALLAVAACLSIFLLRRVRLGSAARICLAVSSLFLGYFLIRTAFSPYEYLARANLNLAIGSLLVYLLAVLYITDSRQRAILVVVLLGLGFANSVVGAVQFFKAADFIPFELMPRSANYGSRASGFFLVPNSLAGFLEICVLMGLSMVWWGRWSTAAKVLCGYVSATCLGGLIITGSRGGYLSIAFGLLIFVSISIPIAIRRFRERGWMILLAVACVALVGAIGVKLAISGNYMLQSRAASIYAKPVDMRLTLWDSALQQFALAPAIGTGSGTFLYYGRQFRAPVVQTDPILVHNEYLQLLAEYGVIGVVLMAIFLLEHGRNGFSWIRRAATRGWESGETQSNSLALAIGAFSCVGAHAVHAALDFNFHVPANALVLALLFGFLANPGGGIRETPSAAGRLLDRTFGVVLVGLGAWMATIAATKFPAEFFNENATLLDAKWISEETNPQIEEAARRGLAFDPKNPELHFRLGRSLLDQRSLSVDPAEAARLMREGIAAHQRALDLAPQDVRMVLALAEALDEDKRFEESQPLFERALSLDPNGGWVRGAYAAHLHRRGLLDQAEKEYLRASQLGYGVEPGLTRLREARK